MTEQGIVLLSSLIGMTGVLLGVGLTSLIDWKLKTKEARLRILEKVYDKRLRAHEEVLLISRLLRTTVSTKNMDTDRNLITYPGLIDNRVMFEKFKGRFYELVNFNTHWLDVELFRELNLIQDYIYHVDILFKNVPDERFQDLALIIKQDFIDLAASLENETLKFFEKDIQKIGVRTKKDHHKYKKPETRKHLQDTELFKKWDQLKRITNANMV